jgi:hypothetical protein
VPKRRSPTLAEALEEAPVAVKPEVEPSPSLPPGKTFSSELANGRTPERAHARTGELLNSRRIKTRNSFDTYKDQMDSLHDLAYLELKQGRAIIEHGNYSDTRTIWRK